MLLQAKQITKSYGTHEVFAEIDLQINEQNRIGLIGPNGAGKSTLLKILIGELLPDQGSVYTTKQKKVAYLAQTLHNRSELTIWEEVKKAFAHLVSMEQELRILEQQMSTIADEKTLQRYADLESTFSREGGYQYESQMRGALHGLGLGAIDWENTQIAELSGGQKTRTSLARMLLEKPDLLILDEPTNYLDMEALQWLEQNLAQYENALLLVSHDRYFLDRLVTHIWEMDNGQLDKYTGNYSSFTKQKEARIQEQAKRYYHQQKDIQNKQTFIQKNIARASTSNLAKSRRKALEKIERFDLPASQKKQVAIRFDIAHPSGRQVVKVHNLSCGYDLPLFAPISFQIERGERIALLGTNGIGKSTLLYTLADKLPSYSGEVLWGNNVDIDLYDQEQKDLSTNETLIDEIWNTHPTLDQTTIRSYLGQFLFSQEDVWKKVGDLSGGEKARLSLLKRLLKRANFLMLDEPTNHLDLLSKENLELALSKYPGTLLFVSHDRYFISRLATKIWELTTSGLTIYDGDYQWYRDQKAFEVAEQKKKSQAKVKTTPSRQDQQKRQQQEKQLQALESEVSQLEESIRQIEAKLCSPEVFQDHQQVSQLEQELQGLNHQLEEQTEEWLLLGEKLASR